ncbi:hypothetical protein GCM10010967_13840 [Dyadobacter beijingensis]|uniref:Cytochrome oxidase maturation protein, cbb3-type n=2 Tax=Dyadobacter beijingensis TaxID=365489 RepID=A0ABQ2HKY2_9BACT|nr:hypothetical protein GCM10010967_13840 [Dyadobacter beijingensis]
MRLSGCHPLPAVPQVVLAYQKSPNPILIMSALYLLILASLLVALGFLGAFIWSVRKGHYDDDYTPSVRILLDDSEKTNTI